MPNPGAFHGSRKEFLLGEKQSYSLGVDGNYTSEALALIYRRYFKRYPIGLPHDTEPSAEHLAAVDDDDPEPEIEEPDFFRLSPDDYEAEMGKIRERKKDIDFRKGQIKRWMAYQYMKDNNVDPKETGEQNPYRVLMWKLTGKDFNRPRMKTPVNTWRKTRRIEIDEELKKKYGPNVPKADLVSLRDKVARGMFAQLNKERRHQWELHAKSEHRVAMEQWHKDSEAAPSTDPVDRQRCIQGLVQFAQPILDMICEVTGWKSTLIAGGPEPAQDGQLNVISLHSGTTSGDVKMTFGHAERANIKKYLIPIYGSFLQKCYTPEECRLRALSTQKGFLPMSDMDLESNQVTIHGISRKSKVTKSASSATGATMISSDTSMIPLSTAPAVLSGNNPPASCLPHSTSNQESLIPSTNVAALVITQAKSPAEADHNSPIQGNDHTTSRSPSPALTSHNVSPPPSPPRSQCPSPRGFSDLPGSAPDGLIAQNDIQDITSASTTLPDSSSPGSHAAPQCGMSAIISRSDVIDAEEHISSNNNNNSGLLFTERRSTRSVKKTSKKILLEEEKVQRGKKRKQGGVLGDGSSSVNQIPVKRRRVGVKAKGGK